MKIMILWRSRKISLSIRSKIPAASLPMLALSKNSPNMQINNQAWINLQALHQLNKKRKKKNQPNKKRR